MKDSGVGEGDGNIKLRKEHILRQVERCGLLTKVVGLSVVLLGDRMGLVGDRDETLGWSLIVNSQMLRHLNFVLRTVGSYKPSWS